MSKEQQNYEAFKISLADTIEKEEKKVSKLVEANNLIKDNVVAPYIVKRQNFLAFCKKVQQETNEIQEYTTNKDLIDKYQKDYWITSDFLKKEVLKIMAKNQKLWFGRLFDNYFELLKDFQRSLLIAETPNEVKTFERMLQEIEALKYKK